MINNAELLTAALEGKDVTAVTYIHDYIQIDFDDAKLSIFTVPVFEPAGPILAKGGDALRNLIGKVVARAVEKENESVSITFVDGSRFMFPIDEESRNQVEAGTLSRVGRTSIVW